MRFADIAGQEELKRHLTGSVDRGRISHAQLFSGEAGHCRWRWPTRNMSAAPIVRAAIRAAYVRRAVR